MELKKIKDSINLLEYAIQNSVSQVKKAGRNTYWLNPCPVCDHKDHFTIYPESNSYSSFSGCCKEGE